jgi:nitroimidazol reductase NimA-like FMN-containing flavoprotein (pyridoxamine 5'-phosphate oxidase superfamily)
MLTQKHTTQRVRELSVDECLDLVASAAAGRIAYDDAEGPIVIPVNHVVDHGTIVVRTSAASNLARCVRGGWASFQVDDLGDRGRASWSVLIRGSIRPLDLDEINALERHPQPQAEGVRALHLRLTPRSVTGRRMVAAP